MSVLTRQIEWSERDRLHIETHTPGDIQTVRQRQKSDKLIIVIDTKKVRFDIFSVKRSSGINYINYFAK